VRWAAMAATGTMAAVAITLLFGIPASARADEPCPGETLISPLYSTDTCLIDMDLNVIRTWHCGSNPAFTAYLLEDGSIVRPCTYTNANFYGGALGGRIQKYSVNGTLTWDFVFSNADHCQHHDVRPMTNGNVLLIAWERKTQQQAAAAGRVNATTEFWPEAIFEIRPNGPTGGTVVWEWHLWDHLIQDVDPAKPNYGVIANHPELLDINLPGASGMGNGDWMHANAIDYHPELNQITFSSHYLNEVYVIDHSTTTQQAAGHAGGRSGMGGDLLYRWGNPQNYDTGDASDQVFFVVHGANWIDTDCPGAGHIVAFNNGDRPGSQNDYSTVVEIVPPLNGYNYTRAAGQPFGPEAPCWSYSDPGSFYSGHFSGAFRLPNGNTLITEAMSSYVFEVTASGETVWDYHAGGNLARAPRYHMAGAAVDDETPTSQSRRTLLRNAPNPFNESTRIAFRLAQPGQVRLAIFDLSGRQIVTLVDAALAAGDHAAEWNGRDESGRTAASGTYLLRLRVDDSVEAERLVILR
jgi:hypothetical protein